MEIRLNDVYRFMYNREWSKKIFDPYHCFDGQLIVKQRSNCELYLKDTYWGEDDSYSKSFTLEEALERGELTFVCNLNDIEPVEKYQMNYYDDKDLFDLSRQHKCYSAYYKRKGAEKSIEKMKYVVEDRIRSIKNEIESRQSTLVKLQEDLDKLESGDMNVYI